MNAARAALSDTEPYLLAVVSPHPDLAQFLRDAQWLAHEQDMDLAVALEHRGLLRSWLNPGEDREVTRFLGRWEVASTTWRTTADIAAMLSRDATQRPEGIVFGPTRVLPWRPGLIGADVTRIARAAGAAGVPLVHDFDEDVPAKEGGTFFGLHWRLDQDRPWYTGYVPTAVAVAMASGLMIWLAPFLPSSSLAIVFLTAIIYSASAYGFGAAAMASLAGVTLNASLFGADKEWLASWTTADVLLFLLFLLVGAITSNLSGGLRYAAASAQRQAREARALYQLTREIAVAADTPDTFAAIVRQCDEAFACRTVLLAPYNSGGIDAEPSARSRAAALQVAYPPDAHLTQDELEAARWSFAHNASTGCGTMDGSSPYSHVVPLETTDGMVAVLVLQDISVAAITASGFIRMIGSMCRLAAIAVERSLRKQEVENARVIAQTEGLRSALLTSISHDFGTPLAAIIGSASSLLSYGSTYTADVTSELLTTILEEAERLGRFVKNVLQMTRLEAGVLVPRLTWTDVEDLITTSIDAVQRRLQNHTIAVDITERLPLVHIDFVLMETVLVNVLDNAVKYAPAESTIVVTARVAGDEVAIDVTDQGRGISNEDLGAVFDKFYRAKQRDRTVPGTGLGLAICKGIIESHGGSIEALSPGLGHGTTIRIRLPVKTPDSAAMAET